MRRSGNGASIFLPLPLSIMIGLAIEIFQPCFVIGHSAPSSPYGSRMEAACSRMILRSKPAADIHPGILLVREPALAHGPFHLILSSEKIYCEKSGT